MSVWLKEPVKETIAMTVLSLNGKIDTTALVRMFRVLEILPMPTFSLTCSSLAG